MLYALFGLLAVILLLQCLALPAFAADTEAVTEVTQATEAPLDPVYATPDAEYGTATVLSGCRTIEAQTPLGGSSRMLDTAAAAFIYELNTGTLIYAYNPDISVSPGGLTKLMTVLIALERGNLEDQITVREGLKKSLPYGARTLGLKSGEEVTMKDLVYCTFLDWDNDCALLLAEHIAGSQENFVQLMNERVCPDDRLHRHGVQQYPRSGYFLSDDHCPRYGKDHPVRPEKSQV